MSGIDLGRRKDPQRKGFTLVELMVVLAMMGVLSAVAAPSVGQWIANYRAETTARQVMTDLQSARMQAVAQRFEFRVSVDVANNQYQIKQGNLPSGSTVWTPVGIVRSMTDPANAYYAQGVKLGANSAPAALDVTFSPLGYATFSAARADGTAEATVTQGAAAPYDVIVSPAGGIQINGGPGFVL